MIWLEKFIVLFKNVFFLSIPKHSGNELNKLEGYVVNLEVSSFFVHHNIDQWGF